MLLFQNYISYNPLFSQCVKFCPLLLYSEGLCETMRRDFGGVTLMPFPAPDEAVGNVPLVRCELCFGA